MRYLTHVQVDMNWVRPTQSQPALPGQPMTTLQEGRQKWEFDRHSTFSRESYDQHARGLLPESLGKKSIIAFAALALQMAADCLHKGVLVLQVRWGGGGWGE